MFAIFSLKRKVNSEQHVAYRNNRNEHMKRKLKVLIIVMLIVFTKAMAQVKVSGVVVDNQNETIPFANIVFVGSTIGVVSDENGKFYLESNKTYDKIDVSFLGFDTKTINVKSR